MRLLLLAALALLLCPSPPARAGDKGVGLLTDESIPRYLDRSRELARAGQWDKVVDILQRIVTGDKTMFPDLGDEALDSAVYSGDGVLYHPARELCLQELADLPPEGLLAYRSAYDDEADKVFRAAGEVEGLQHRLAALARVYERYPVSSKADDALDLAADIERDLGDFAKARSLYLRLLDEYPKDTDQEVPLVLAKAAFCCAQIGDTKGRDALLRRLRDNFPRASLRIDGRAVAAADVAKERLLQSAEPGGASTSGWPVPEGSPDRARVAEDIPEGSLPSVPFWTFSYRSRDARLVPRGDKFEPFWPDRAATAGGGSRKPRDAAVPHEIPAVRPVLWQGRLFYKDYSETVVREPGSGAYVPWRTAMDPQWVRPGTSSTRDSGAFESIYDFLDFGGNTVVCGDDSVAVLESETPPRHLLSQPSWPPRKNHLDCYEKQGTLRWAWEAGRESMAVRDAGLSDEWSHDYHAHEGSRFLGPGLYSAGRIYTLVLDAPPAGRPGTYLWVFDAKDGRVIARTFLHGPDENGALLPQGASIAITGGSVYAVTGAGIVAELDELPPCRVRWIRRYPRDLPDGANGNGAGGPPRFVPLRGGGIRIMGPNGPVRPGAKQHFAYNDPVVAGGVLVAAPADSTEAFALDIRTGKLLWKVTRKDLSCGDEPVLLGVAGGEVLFAGSRIAALDLRKGTPLWGPRDIGGAPCGRGFLGRKYAYVPAAISTGSKVARFALDGGEPAAPLTFSAPRLGNLLYAGGRLFVAGDEGVSCYTLPDAEIARVDAEVKKSGETAALLHERARIEVEAKERDKARADFAKAVAADAGDPLLRWEAVQNLLALAVENKDPSPLTEARALARQAATRAQIDWTAARLAAEGTDASAALDALDTLVKGRDPRTEVALDPDTVVSVAEAARRERAEIFRSMPGAKEAFASRVRAEIAAAVQKGDAETLALIPQRYGEMPPSDESYFALFDLERKLGKNEDAELALRRFIRDLPTHPRRDEAHLDLALLLAQEGRLLDARTQRDEALRLMEESDRVRLAKKLDALDKLIPPAPPAGPLPEVKIPLSALPLGNAGTPIRCAQPLPAPLTGGVLLATRDGLRAIDGEGKTAWDCAIPEEKAAPLGSPGDPAALPVATAVASARFLRVVDGALLVGDVWGLRRIDPKNGAIVWSSAKGKEEEAAHQARRMLQDLRSDLQLLRATGKLVRRGRLPRYALSDRHVVCANPYAGVQAYDAATGAVVFTDKGGAPGALVGPPCIRGGLIAVGWSNPGKVFVYDLDGREVGNHEIAGTGDQKTGVLLAPPLLDPFGRLYVVASTDEQASSGALHIVDARNREPDYPVTLPVNSIYADVLHADGSLLVYHDGGTASSDGGEGNLHFLDLKSRRQKAVAAPDALRSLQVAEDGFHLFVLSSEPGLAGLGARLFRVDLVQPKAGRLDFEGLDVLPYALPPSAEAYARPLLTRRFVAVASAGARAVSLRLYEREASQPGSGPHAVFASAGQDAVVDEFQQAPEDHVDFAAGIEIASRGGGFVLEGPFGPVSLRAQ